MKNDTSSRDEARLEETLRDYAPALRRLAFSYTRDPQQREDLFQEIAVALWKALPKFRGESSTRTYVYRVAHNTAIRFVTSKHRKTALEESVRQNDHEMASDENPERDAIRKQRRQLLSSAVSELPVIDRQIVLLHLEGLSTTEIVEVTGLSEGVVAMRLSRIRRRLAARLNQSKTEEKL